MIRRCLNGETHMSKPHVSIRQSITYGREPGELKHLSTHTLVYLYGDVPYVDKIQDQFRIDFTRTPKEEVIAHMVEDLQFAVENQNKTR